MLDVTDKIAIAIRLIGILVMLIGLVLGFKVIQEAWQLYQQPERIQRFANAVENGSNLDALLASLVTDNGAPKAIDNHTKNNSKHSKPLRLSYFLAWGIVVVLLMLIGSLAATALRTGGQLALYDLEVKHFASKLSQQLSAKKD